MVTAQGELQQPLPTEDLTPEQKLGLAFVSLLTPVAGYALGGKKGAMAGAQAGFTAAGGAAGDIGKAQEKQKDRDAEEKKYSARRAAEFQEKKDLIDYEHKLKPAKEKEIKPVTNAKGQIIDANTGNIIDASTKPDKEGKDDKPTATEVKKKGLAEIGAVAEGQYQAAAQKGKSAGNYSATDPWQFIDNSDLAPAWMKSDAANEAQAAASSWIDSYLRDESGAAIPPAEKAEYYRTYFPQPGDTEQTVANKAVLRNQKMAAAAAAGGTTLAAPVTSTGQAAPDLQAAARAELERRKLERQKMSNGVANGGK